MFELRVTDIFSLGQRAVMTGMVVGGPVSVGDRLRIESPRASAIFTVEGIERDRTIIPTATIGESIAILASSSTLKKVSDGYSKLESGGYRIESLTLRGVPAKWWEFWK